MDTPATEAAWRAALSALFDGEEPALPLAAIGAHLGECAGCAAWAEQAAAVNVRFGALPVLQPNLGERVVNSVEVHLCACRQGGTCLCRDCQCGAGCTCGASVAT